MHGADMGTQLLDIRDIKAKAKCGLRTAYNIVKRPGFPAPQPLGPRSPRWIEDEVDAYFRAQPRDTDRSEPPTLKAAKTAKRGGNGGSGGVQNATPAGKPESARGLSDGLSVELEKVAA